MDALVGEQRVQRLGPGRQVRCVGSPDALIGCLRGVRDWHWQVRSSPLMRDGQDKGAHVLTPPPPPLPTPTTTLLPTPAVLGTTRSHAHAHPRPTTASLIACRLCQLLSPPAQPVSRFRPRSPAGRSPTTHASPSSTSFLAASSESHRPLQASQPTPTACRRLLVAQYLVGQRTDSPPS